MIGAQLSHFRILRKLGAGGMGEVYEAEDVSLGRRVALKILPATVENDAEALERFRREARSASALHHANICTVYEVGADQGRHFIAMEMLEGTPLDEMIGGKSMKITTVLDIGTQVGEALRAAHEAGVIHRDIKPANIFVTRTGMAKLLDFGIAKQTFAARGASAAGEDADTLALGSEDFSMTRPGTAVGTVAYMSPEQASGQALDSRTDLFSLGAVLYEMVTGRQPFTGATSAVIFNAILSQAPAAPISLNSDCPPELEAAIHKCLEKDREIRCQSAAELRADLMRIRRKLDSVGVSTAQQAVASAVTTGTAPARPPSSSSVLIAEVRRHKMGATFVLLLVVALVAGAAYGIYSAIAARPFPFQHSEMRRVQDDATVLFTAISPDGKYLADVHREERGAESIHLRLMSAASETTVMPGAPAIYGGIVFSRDATQIYFRRQQDAASGAYSLYRVPQLGGSPMLVAENVAGDPAFSPDGARMAFMRAAGGDVSVVLANSDGGSPTTLVSGIARPQPLSWSADGKTLIAGMARATDANAGLGGNLTAIKVSDGSLKEIPVPRDTIVSRPQWYPDGEGVLALYRSAAGIGRNQIAFIDYPEGKLHPVTNDTNTYSSLSLSGDGKLLAAVETTADDRNLFLMPAGDTGPSARAEQLTDHRTVRGFAWMPDGGIAAAPDFSLVALDAQGEVKATLVDVESGAQALNPSACGNRRDVVFASIGNGGSVKLSIWRVDAGGGNMQPVSDGSLDRYPICAADSKSVFFVRGNGAGAAIMQIPLAGGAAQKATELEDWRGWFFDVSPDGKLLAMITPANDGKPRLAIVKLGSTEPPATFAVPEEISGGPRFLPGSESVAYAVRKNGADNLWQQALTGPSPPRAITQFTSDEITDFHWSPRGNRLGMVRGHTDSGVVLIRDTAAK